MGEGAPGGERHVVLVGFMGAGKSTVGRLLAERLELPFVDADPAIEARAGRSVREVFAADGEDAFRDLEEAVVAELLALPRRVIALGGGACGRAATRAALAGHDVVHLEVAHAEVLARIGGDEGRPVLARADLADLHAARLALYAEVATVVVATDGRTPAEVVTAVADALPAR